jgi:putative salt-induced outer membrane protein YdiY
MRKLALMLLISLCANASEIVFLKNGDRVSGSVENISDGKLLLKSSVFGDLKMDVSEVSRIESTREITVITRDKTVIARSLSFTEKNANISVTDTHAMSVPRELVRDMHSPEFIPAPVEHGRWEDWSASIDAGLSAARGNSKTTNLNLGFKTQRTTSRDHLGLGVTSIFAENSTLGQAVTGANAIHSGARYDLNLSDNAFGFALANFDSDQLQNLDLRSVVGGGLGLRATQSDRTSLDVFAGASLNNEMFSTQPNRRSGELITGQELNLKFSPRAILSQRLMFFPNVTDAGQYRLAFDSTATLKFNNWLGWQSTLSNTYLSNPAPGARNNDVLITTGIRVMLGEETTFKPRLKMPIFVN